MTEHGPRFDGRMGQEGQEAEVLEALAGINSGASLALVQKTRRSVRDVALALEEQRLRRRRTVGFALMAFLVLSVLLAPALWNSVDDLVAGEHVMDVPTQLTFLLLILFPAMLAALVAVWKGQSGLRRGVHDDRQL